MVNRKDFRPSSRASKGINDKDRALIKSGVNEKKIIDSSKGKGEYYVAVKVDGKTNLYAFDTKKQQKSFVKELKQKTNVEYATSQNISVKENKKEAIERKNTRNVKGETFEYGLVNSNTSQLEKGKDYYFVTDRFTTTRYPKTKEGLISAKNHIKENRKIDEKIKTHDIALEKINVGGKLTKKEQKSIDDSYK